MLPFPAATTMIPRDGAAMMLSKRVFHQSIRNALIQSAPKLRLITPVNTYAPCHCVDRHISQYRVVSDKWLIPLCDTVTYLFALLQSCCSLLRVVHHPITHTSLSYHTVSPVSVQITHTMSSHAQPRDRHTLYQ